MELMDAIYTRRSHRAFTNQPVAREAVEKLLSAAVQAPSASNMQPWAFAVIEDAALLREISDASRHLLLDEMDDGPQSSAYRARLSNPDFNIFYNAGTLVLVLASQETPFGAGDCCLAAQNIMLSAHDLGLGTCWIGFAQMYLNRPEAKSKLGIPEGYAVAAPLIVGHPAGAPPVPTKRAPNVLFWR